jgi:hypothetical protein
MSNELASLWLVSVSCTTCLVLHKGN